MDLKKITSMLSKAWNTVKVTIQRFWNWKKENLGIWILKTILVIALCVIGYYFISYILPTILALAVLVLLYIWDKEPASIQQYNVEMDCIIARNLLLDILHRHADLFDIVPPKNVEEITPTKYYVQQNIQGHVFYRFIVRSKPDCEPDFISMQESVNTYICQFLQAGYPNVSQPFYRNVPHYYIFNIGHDSCHNGYFCIDAMPIVNDSCITFVNMRKQQNASSYGVINASPEDKDF